MKRYIPLSLSIVSASLALAQEPAAALPTWLQSKIAEYKSLPPFSPPRSIATTKHGGNVVYFVSAACCDIPSELYDEKGVLLCYPTGGFAGGDGKCPTFVPGRMPMTTVWRDDRAASAYSPKGSGKR